MSPTHLIGKKGENLATNFLIEKGYLILDTNWRSSHLEIDIIAQQEDSLVFIEVKTRKSNHFGEPEQWVTKAKQKNLIMAANTYIRTKNLDLDVRFDIISILLHQNKHSIHHLKGAFYPTIG